MKSSENSKTSAYVKPELVVYGDFSKVTKLTGTGLYTDAAFTAKTPVSLITFTS